MTSLMHLIFQLSNSNFAKAKGILCFFACFEHDCLLCMIVFFCRQLDTTKFTIALKKILTNAKFASEIGGTFLTTSKVKNKFVEA